MIRSSSSSSSSSNWQERHCSFLLTSSYGKRQPEARFRGFSPFSCPTYCCNILLQSIPAIEKYLKKHSTFITILNQSTINYSSWILRSPPPIPQAEVLSCVVVVSLHLPLAITSRRYISRPLLPGLLAPPTALTTASCLDTLHLHHRSSLKSAQGVP